MPVRQQYLTATAITTLIAVMVILVLFDFLADRNRSAGQSAIRAGWVSSGGPGVFNGRGGASLCGACGWQGICPRSGRCPNCRMFLASSNVGFPTNAAFPAANAPYAGFLWSRSQANAAVSQPSCVLSCPGCNFRMACSARPVSNSIRCPRCPSYLMAAVQMTASPPAQQFLSNFNAGTQWNLPTRQVGFVPSYGPAYAPGWGQGQGQGYGQGYCLVSPWGQEAAFVNPGVDAVTAQQQQAVDGAAAQQANWGGGYGRGLNPYCPLR